MRLRLGMDCPENEVVENRSFRVQFSGEGTPYVQTPGEPYIRGKRKVPPEATHLLCVVEIVAPWAMQSKEEDKDQESMQSSTTPDVRCLPPDSSILVVCTLRVK